MNDETLTEQIVSALAGFPVTVGDSVAPIRTDEAREIARAVLPIVGAAVKRGQAEALPVGTVAISEQFPPEVFVKADTDTWLGTHAPGAFIDQSAVGFDALVPIEAEEEAQVRWEDDDTSHMGDISEAREVVSNREDWEPPCHAEIRYVTEWTEDA